MYRSFILLLAITVVTAFTGVASLPAADDKPDTVKPILLFNGKDLTGWKFRGPESKSKWVVGIAQLDEKDPSRLVVTHPDKSAPGELQLINTSGSLDIYTDQKFGDGTFEIEVMVPKGSNSGAYVMGQYEVQIFDSFGQKNLGYVDMGGIYGVAAPKVNAAKKPGEWQKFVIEYLCAALRGRQEDRQCQVCQGYAQRSGHPREPRSQGTDRRKPECQGCSYRPPHASRRPRPDRIPLAQVHTETFAAVEDSAPLIDEWQTIRAFMMAGEVHGTGA